MKLTPQKIEKLDTKKSIKRAKTHRKQRNRWVIEVPNGKYSWSNAIERVDIIRKRLPYESIEVISKKTGLPVRQVLTMLSLAQTTYNKKKRENELLSGSKSEAVLLLTELVDFGTDVFNNESLKFKRWLKKPNIALGGFKPVGLFDSITGIQEVKKALNRLEYGNMA